MLNIVLFLLAILIIVVLIKMLKLGKRAAKIFGIVIFSVVLAAAGIAGWVSYSDHQNALAREAKLKDWANGVADYSLNHTNTLAEILANPDVSEQDKEYARMHEKDLPHIVYMPTVVGYARALRSARGLSVPFVGSQSDDMTLTKTAVHVDQGVDGVKDVVVLSYDSVLYSYEAADLVRAGFKGSSFASIFSLDGSKMYNRHGQWEQTKPLALEKFKSAKEL